MTPVPTQMPLPWSALFVDWRTIFEFPVTRIPPLTVTVEPPPILKAPPPDTVMLFAATVVPLPSVSEP